MPTIVDSKFHTDHTLELSQAINRGSLFQVRQMIKTLPTAGIAHLLESSPPKTRSVLWQLIDKESEGEVIQYLNEDLQSEILSELDAKEVVELTEGLETDDLADFSQTLVPTKLSTPTKKLSRTAIHSRSKYRLMKFSTLVSLSYGRDRRSSATVDTTITWSWQTSELIMSAA